MSQLDLTIIFSHFFSCLLCYYFFLYYIILIMKKVWYARSFSVKGTENFDKVFVNSKDFFLKKLFKM